MKSLNTKINLAGMTSFLLVLAALLGFSSVIPTVTATTATATPPVTATTDNESVDVVINWEPSEIEPEQETEFTIDFQDPSSGDSISHVNYNFEIIDENNGETVESMTDLHTHSGSDEQTVTFDTAGSFDFVVTIIGTGIDPPFDTTQSGTAETVITVGQEEESSPVAPDDDTATTDDDTTTTTTSSSGLELLAQPVWDEQVTSTGVTPINETHSIGTFIGNGTMTVPDTGETVSMTNNGTAIISPVPGYADTVSASGREYVFSEEDDDDISAITFHEIIRYNPETFEGNGLVIAVFDNNATGSLAPFNGMMVVGTHEEDPATQTATIRLWEWESGIPIPPPVTTMEESPPSLTMNTTTTSELS
ncbi:MAG TPA: hypothetical protein VFZ67_12605 [Nitrososphaera sp.]